MSGIFDNTGIDYSGIDSVTIIFDNQRIIVQYCDEMRELAVCDIERNIMRDDNEEYFVKTEVEKRTTRYTYTLTEADYERAVAIEAK